MLLNIILGALIPFFGTALGAFCVFFLKKKNAPRLSLALNGFASGVMIACSVWSLLIPSIELGAELGFFSFAPASLGFLLGIFSLWLLDKAVSRVKSNAIGGRGWLRLGASAMLFLAVTIHNIPEGVAVGVGLSSYLTETISLSSALALSVGIAIQNIPEGAILSAPIGVEQGRWRGFLYGTLSGAVEPIFALITVAVSGLFIPIFPYLLSFAAGAMIFVTVTELIPEAFGDESARGVSLFSLATGFVLMMSLDVALG